MVQNGHGSLDIAFAIIIRLTEANFISTLPNEILSCERIDDMKGGPNLAETQIEIVEYVQCVTDKTILFCPTYYSDDPILDKVFGRRPSNYLEKIGTLPQKVQIFWTGNFVC